MVCISAGVGSDIPCLIPGHIFFIYQDTHQLRHCHGRMGIIQLEGHFLRQIMQIIMFLFKFGDSSLDTCRDKEVLLFQTQLFSCIMVIVRI